MTDQELVMQAAKAAEFKGARTIAVPRCHRLLQWAAEDLADAAIAANPQRLALERATVIKRLSPHIEEIVVLAWAQLQLVQSAESSRSSP